MFEGTIDGVDGKDGVFTDVGVAVFQAGAAEWDEKFKKFGVPGFFGGSASLRLRPGYIHQGVAGGDREYTGKDEVGTELTRSFRIGCYKYDQPNKVHLNK